MLGYLKLKTNDEELYESDYLNYIKDNKWGKIQYYICNIYFKFVVLIKNFFNIITVKQIYNGFLFILPFENINQKKIERGIYKLQILMKKYNIQTIVVSEELKQYYNLKKNMELIDRKVSIIEGKGLIPYLIKEIFDYILQKSQKIMEEQDLYICVKEDKTIYIDNILYLSKYFKTINIVTSNINCFQKLAERYEQKENIIITVTNNKKKSLKKARYIINFDFDDKQIKKYNIYRNAIILTINETETYSAIGFDGVEIKQIGVNTSDEIKEYFKKYNLLGNCSQAALYESLINKKQDLSRIKKQMKEDNITVIKLYGNNGEINNNEFSDL